MIRIVPMTFTFSSGFLNLASTRSVRRATFLGGTPKVPRAVHASYGDSERFDVQCGTVRRSQEEAKPFVQQHDPNTFGVFSTTNGWCICGSAGSGAVACPLARKRLRGGPVCKQTSLPNRPAKPHRNVRVSPIGSVLLAQAG